MGHLTLTIPIRWLFVIKKYKKANNLIQPASFQNLTLAVPDVWLLLQKF